MCREQAGDIELAEFGHEKDKQKKPIYNYSIAYDRNNRVPLFYEAYPGSINDVSQLLSLDPMYPSLKSHEITELSRRYGMKVWQSYLENKKSGARRMYWVYGPGQQEITIIGLEPHPEDAKNGAYDRIKLSDL